MSFIVWWGTDHHVLPRGIVLDVCGRCRKILPFAVYDHFAQSHLYGLGITPARYLGSTRRCWTCRAEAPMDDGAYDDVLAFSSAEAPDAFDRLLAATNSRLAAILETGERLREKARESPYRSPADEGAEHLPQALDLLEELLLGGADVRKFAAKLGKWEELSERERKEVVDALRGLAWLGSDPRAASPE